MDSAISNNASTIEEGDSPSDPATQRLAGISSDGHANARMRD
jgi:hypothetical protein